jgi:hypothetical protein
MFIEMLLFILIEKAERNMNSREVMLGFLGRWHKNNAKQIIQKY